MSMSGALYSHAKNAEKMASSGMLADQQAAKFDSNAVDAAKVAGALQLGREQNATELEKAKLGQTPNLPDNSGTWNNAQTPNSGGAAAPGGLASLGVQRNGNAYSAAPGGLTTGLSGPSLMQQSNDAYNQRHGPASGGVTYGPEFKWDDGAFRGGFGDYDASVYNDSTPGYLAGGEVEGPPGLDQVPAQLPNGAPARINDGEYILPKGHVIGIAAKALGKKAAMLPEEKLHEIGIALLDAEVAQSTGQQPGARPMPPLPGQEQMGAVPGMAGGQGMPWLPQPNPEWRTPMTPRLLNSPALGTRGEELSRLQHSVDAQRAADAAKIDNARGMVNKLNNARGAQAVAQYQPRFPGGSLPPMNQMPTVYRPAGLPALPWQGTSSPVNYAPAQLSGPGVRPMLPAPGDIPYRPAATGPAIPGGHTLGMDEMRANAQQHADTTAKQKAARAGLKPGQDTARAAAQARYAAGEATSGASKVAGMLGKVGRAAMSAPAAGATMLLHSPDTVSTDQEMAVLDQFAAGNGQVYDPRRGGIVPQTPAPAAGQFPSAEEFYNIQDAKAQGQAQRNVIDADQRARAKAYYQSTGLNPRSVHPEDTAYMAGLQEAFSQRTPGTNYAGQIMQRNPFKEAPAQQTQQADPITQFHETVRRLGMASGLAPKDAYQYIAPRVLEAMQQQAPDPRMAQLQWEQQKFGAQQQFDWNKFVAEQTLAQQRAMAEQQGRQHQNVFKRQVPINPQDPMSGTADELVYFAGVDPETGQPVYLSQSRQGQGNNPYAAADAKRRQQ